MSLSTILIIFGIIIFVIGLNKADNDKQESSKGWLWIVVLMLVLLTMCNAT